MSFFCSKQWFDPVTPFLGCAVFLCWITADTCGFSLYFLLATTSSWFNIGSFWRVFPQRSNNTVFLSVWKPVERAVIEKVLPNTYFFSTLGSIEQFSNNQCLGSLELSFWPLWPCFRPLNCVGIRALGNP